MRAAVIISLISLLVSLLIGEAYLRLNGYAPKAAWVNANFDGSNWGMEDPELGWVNRPGVFASLELNGAAMSFQPDHTRTSRPVKNVDGGRPADVLVVGCSYSQGYSVADAETYPWRLGERFPGVIVDNFGTGGYGAAQAMMRLRKELAPGKPAPKLVIYGLIAHQLPRTVAEPGWVKYLTNSKGDMVIPPHVVVDADGRLAERPLETVPAWPLEHQSAVVSELHAAWLRHRLGDRGGQRAAAMIAAIRAMRDMTEARGGRFLVAVLDEMSFPEGKDDYDAVLAALKPAGIEHAKCVDAEYNASLGDYLVNPTGHPNGRAHQRWADCVAPWIAANLPPVSGGAVSP